MPSRAEFRRDPKRYEIQWDGACGKMGPASGVGSPDRWLVHEGHIYIFASDICKRTFASNPAAHIEHEEKAPAQTLQQARAGRALLEKAAQFTGAALESLRGIYLRWESEVEKKKYAPAYRSYWHAFPGASRRDDEYLEWGAESYVIAPGGSSITTPGAQPKALTPSAQVVIARELGMELIPLLRARKDSGFTVWKEANGRIGVAYKGAVRMIDLDTASGEIRLVSYRGRGPGGPFGQVVHTYGEYRQTGGLRLPHRVTTTIDGKPWPARSYRALAIEVNPSLPDGHFRIAAQ